MTTSSVTGSIEIDAPIEEVFAFVSDPQRRIQALAPALGRSIVVSDVETSPEGVVTSWKWTTQFLLPLPTTPSRPGRNISPTSASSRSTRPRPRT